MSQRKHKDPVRMRSPEMKLHQRTHTQMEEATQTATVTTLKQRGNLDRHFHPYASRVKGQRPVRTV